MSEFTAELNPLDKEVWEIMEKWDGKTGKKY